MIFNENKSFIYSDIKILLIVFITYKKKNIDNFIKFYFKLFFIICL